LPEAAYPLDAQRYNWGYLRNLTERGAVMRPALLLELGFKEDLAFVEFITDNVNQSKVGYAVGCALADWLQNP
jgi:hypothetical protein